MRERKYAEIEIIALLFDGTAVYERFYHRVELLAEKYRNDSRRCFISSESVIVSRCSHGKAQQLGIFVNALYHCRKEGQELHVLHRRLTGVQKVLSVVGGKRPVIMLSGAVHAVEGLFVQQADHSVTKSCLLHDLHRELVLVGGSVRSGEYRCHLMLRGSYLIMLGL